MNKTIQRDGYQFSYYADDSDPNINLETVDSAWRMFRAFEAAGLSVDACGCCGSPFVDYEGNEFATVNVREKSFNYPKVGTITLSSLPTLSKEQVNEQ